jgi:hypothetical protein
VPSTAHHIRFSRRQEPRIASLPAEASERAGTLHDWHVRPRSQLALHYQPSDQHRYFVAPHHLVVFVAEDLTVIDEFAGTIEVRVGGSRA